MVNIIFFVIDENKYSLSPLISIAEEFPFKITIIKIPKQVYSKIDKNEINNNIYMFFNSSDVINKINKDDLNIFVLSWTSWYRRFFILLNYFLKNNFNKSLIFAGGSDVTGSYKILYSFFDSICIGEGELFFFKSLYIILDTLKQNKYNKDKLLFLNNDYNNYKNYKDYNNYNDINDNNNINNYNDINKHNNSDNYKTNVSFNQFKKIKNYLTGVFYNSKDKVYKYNIKNSINTNLINTNLVNTNLINTNLINTNFINTNGLNNINKTRSINNEIFADINDIALLIKLYLKKHRSIGINITEDNEENIIKTLYKFDNPIDQIFALSPVFPTKTKFFHPSEITRGCSGLCYFCQTPYISGIYEKHKNIYILSEYLKYSLNFNKFYFRFISPNFLSYYYNLSKITDIKIEKLFNKIELFNFKPDLKEVSKKFSFNKEKIPNIEIFDFMLSHFKSFNSNIKLFLGTFPSEISINFVNKEIIKLLKTYAENNDIVIGLQTASNNLLKKIGRNHDLNFFDKKIDIVAKHFNLIIDLIFGFPYETSKDRKTTFSYINNLSKRYRNKVKFNFHYFLPLPGTPLKNKKPTPLNKNEIKTIYTFIGNKNGFGNWKAQMEEFENRINIDDLKNFI